MRSGKDFLMNEPSMKKQGKAFIPTNMIWLFTWYGHLSLNIPNTTNAIDGHFAGLKNKLRNHNGLSKQRKMKFIDEFIKA